MYRSQSGIAMSTLTALNAFSSISLFAKRNVFKSSLRMRVFTLLISSSLLLLKAIKSEGEIEKLQSKLVEMKKKLDNTTAAMQELGRENQSLQVQFDFKQSNLLILFVGLVRNKVCMTFVVGYLSTVIKVFLWCTRTILLSVG